MNTGGPHGDSLPYNNTLVSKAPAQSVAMFVATDGLLLRLGIDRFHVSRQLHLVSRYNGSTKDAAFIPQPLLN